MERTRSWKLGKDRRRECEKIDNMLMSYSDLEKRGDGVQYSDLEKRGDGVQYSDLEKRGDGVQYMMNDCLKFRLHLTVQAA